MRKTWRERERERERERVRERGREGGKREDKIQCGTGHHCSIVIRNSFFLKIFGTPKLTYISTKVHKVSTVSPLSTTRP